MIFFFLISVSESSDNHPIDGSDMSAGNYFYIDGIKTFNLNLNISAVEQSLTTPGIISSHKESDSSNGASEKSTEQSK